MHETLVIGLGLCLYVLLWVLTLGAFRPLSLERSGVYILTAGLSAGIAFGADRLMGDGYGLNTLARTLGESAFLALVLFLRSVRLNLSRKQEIVGSWLVLLATVLHLALNLTLTGAVLLWVMAIQIVALFSWVLREAVLLQRVQPSGMTRFLVAVLMLQIFVEVASRGTMGVLLWLEPTGRGADWAATFENWLWITFSVGFAVLTTTAAVLMEAFRSDKFRLEQVVQQIEGRLRDRESAMLALLLGHADRHKDPGMASLAHELRQPLQSIQLNAEYLSKGKSVNRAEEVEILQEILRENRRAAELLQGLRSIFINDTPGQREGLQLSTWLMDWVRARAPELLTQHNILLRLQVQSDLRVRIHPSQIEVVLQNLVLNAQQALSGHPRGVIDIALVAEDQEARIDVSDNGPGMAPELAQKIFDMGFTTRPESMGIGLWLCRRIAQTHGGRMQFVPSQEGTHMRFYLPLSDSRMGS